MSKYRFYDMDGDLYSVNGSTYNKAKATAKRMAGGDVYDTEEEALKWGAARDEVNALIEQGLVFSFDVPCCLE